MKILVIILIITVLFIMLSYIFAFSSHRKQNRFLDAIQTKKGCFKIIVIILSPVILYCAITLVLMLVRWNCFTAQHVYIGDHHFISYNDEAYVEFTDSEEITKMYDTVGGDWSGGEGYVLQGPMRFPYLEYWELDMFIEEFKVSADGEYMITHTLGGQRNYRRAEE